VTTTADNPSDRDVQQTPDRHVATYVAIMRRHGLQHTDAYGDDGPGDLWTAARELAAKSLTLATSAQLVEELHSRISAVPPTTGTING
jgi:hypothetical protein